MYQIKDAKGKNWKRLKLSPSEARGIRKASPKITLSKIRKR